MDSSFWFETINLGWSIVYIKESQVIISKLIVFLTLKIIFVLANSADSDEMPHYAAFHLGFHCLPKKAFRPVRKGPARIQVNLNTWNLKKNTGGFFSPSHEMEYRWKAI